MKAKSCTCNKRACGEHDYGCPENPGARTSRMPEVRFKQLKRKKLGSFDALDILEILQELDRARAAEREVPDWQGLTAEVLVLHEDV